MSGITYARDFACTPAELWRWLVESDKLKLWLKGTEEHRYLAPGPVAKGSKFVMSIKEGRRATPYEGEILACEPERALLLRMTGGCGPRPMTIEVGYKLSRLGSSTHVDYTCRMELPPGILWRIMGWIGRAVSRAMIKRFFDGLAKHVERR